MNTGIERRTALLMLAALGSLAAVRARAQSAPHGQPAGKVARIGVVLFSTPQVEPNFAAFVAGLRDLGYVEGRNVSFEHRYAEGHPERFRDLAQQIAAVNSEVIVVLGGDMVPSVKDATRTIPIVMLTSNDPVEARLVNSFARPGGNLTGVAFVSSETGAKRLQILKEAVPALARAAVLWNIAMEQPTVYELVFNRKTAKALGVKIPQSLLVRAERLIE